MDRDIIQQEDGDVHGEKDKKADIFLHFRIILPIRQQENLAWIQRFTNLQRENPWAQAWPMGRNHEQRQDKPSAQSRFIHMTGADNSNDHNHEQMDEIHHQAMRVRDEDCG